MSKLSTPKVAAKKARGARRKIAAKVAVAKARTSRATHRRTNSKAVAEKAHVQRKTAPQVAAGELLDTRSIAAQFENFRETQVPDTMRALAQKNIAQTRELYERSRGTLRSVLESWEKSFGAAAQGAVALNRKLLDIAEGNIDANFALARGLAGAKNLPMSWPYMQPIGANDSAISALKLKKCAHYQQS